MSSVYATLPLSSLEKHLEQLMDRYATHATAKETEEMATVADLMKQVGAAINIKKSDVPETEMEVATLDSNKTKSNFCPIFSARPPKRESDCRAFKKYGSCKRGNRCWWKHDPRYKVKKKISVANQEDASEVMLSSQ